MRMLYLLRSGEYMPIQIALPPTSLMPYGITLEQMKQYFIEHQHAREIGDKKMMEKIEYHLTYINFHYECGLLATGQYDKLPEVIKNW